MLIFFTIDTFNHKANIPNLSKNLNSLIILNDSLFATSNDDSHFTLMAQASAFKTSNKQSFLKTKIWR